MSKVFKSSDPSPDSNRPITPVLRTRRNNGLLNPTPSNAKLMIGKQESPYSQIQSISKTRSSSNLKNKSPIRFKNVSPNRCSNQSIVLKSNDSKRSLFERKQSTASKHSSLSNSYHDSKDITTEKLANYQKEASILEVKLNDILNDYQKKPESTQTTKKIFEIHKKIFEEVIQKDKIFGGILIKIKEAYDLMISSNPALKSLKEYKVSIKDLTKNLNSQLEITKSQEKKIEKLSKENFELSKSLERSEQICTEIQKKLCYITNFNVSELPKDEIRWKALLLENKNYSEAYGRVKEENRNYKYKEKKLLKLIVALKQRGYPVEEVYENDVEKKKNKELPHYSGSEDLESNSEAENLVSGRPMEKEKPQIVPSLNLIEIEPESISSSSSFISNTTESQY